MIIDDAIQVAKEFAQIAENPQATPAETAEDALSRKVVDDLEHDREKSKARDVYLDAKNAFEGMIAGKLDVFSLYEAYRALCNGKRKTVSHEQLKTSPKFTAEEIDEARQRLHTALSDEEKTALIAMEVAQIKKDELWTTRVLLPKLTGLLNLGKKEWIRLPSDEKTPSTAIAALLSWAAALAKEQGARPVTFDVAPDTKSWRLCIHPAETKPKLDFTMLEKTLKERLPQLLADSAVWEKIAIGQGKNGFRLQMDCTDENASFRERLVSAMCFEQGRINTDYAFAYKIGNTNVSVDEYRLCDQDAVKKNFIVLSEDFADKVFAEIGVDKSNIQGQSPTL